MKNFTQRTEGSRKKVDKEVMRPHYQKYHEVRNDMTTLRASIESKLGFLPAELQELADNDATPQRSISDSTAGGSRSSNSHTVIVQRSTTVSLLGGEDEPGVVHDFASLESRSLGPDSVDDDDELMAKYESNSDAGKKAWSSSETGSSGRRDSVNAWTKNAADPQSRNPSIEELQREKRTLHIILKAYERDFNQIHGRHVMKPEDIAPVAADYQRYKELKRRLKDST